MKAPMMLIAGLIFFAGVMEAQNWCFSSQCLETPNLAFTAGHDYERAPEFRSTPVTPPPYEPVRPLDPLSVTKQFFTLAPPTLDLTPPVAIGLPSGVLPGVVHTLPAHTFTAPALQLPAMPAPVAPTTGGFSTGVGMPSFTPHAP